MSTKINAELAARQVLKSMTLPGTAAQRVRAFQTQLWTQVASSLSQLSALEASARELGAMQLLDEKTEPTSPAEAPADGAGFAAADDSSASPSRRLSRHLSALGGSFRRPDGMTAEDAALAALQVVKRREERIEALEARVAQAAEALRLVLHAAPEVTVVAVPPSRPPLRRCCGRASPTKRRRAVAVEAVGCRWRTNRQASLREW